MPDTQAIEQAILESIQTEKNAMDFYLQAAGHMKDPDAIRTFEVLAREERTHAKHFFDSYRGDLIGDFETFINRPPAVDSLWLIDLDEELAGEFNERKAMLLAMKKEQELEKSLRDTAARMKDPDVKAVFEKNADETRNHYEVIEAEYARLMAMVDLTDMDTFVRE